MDSPLALLLHQLNNLLGVIYAQAELARRTPGEAAKLEALRLIEQAAQRAEQEARRIRREAGGAEA
jgi:signal transduction histidine kinase